MIFNFTSKTGRDICNIEARDKVTAKCIYKKKLKAGEVSTPMSGIIVTKCDH